MGREGPRCDVEYSRFHTGTKSTSAERHGVETEIQPHMLCFAPASRLDQVLEIDRRPHIRVNGRRENSAAIPVMALA